ncbi:hypothetical protein [Methylobacterium sp. J-090]|uniref:hypothetical protein n=1 Tax=Methylobacterium sp. J-090 TaxID=2836666 RepID=UPI001FB8A882|nr:hypothetical protein [Methylobacterium sp. J-090]MCJ2084309.1 hypothetical protein [Methylobacterium sp. J-090]
MMLSDFEQAVLADEMMDRRAQHEARRKTVLGAPEAQGRDLVAFALLIRFDLSAEDAVLYLREAPTLLTVAEVSAWVEAIPRPPVVETLQ